MDKDICKSCGKVEDTIYITYINVGSQAKIPICFDCYHSAKDEFDDLVNSDTEFAEQWEGELEEWIVELYIPDTKYLLIEEGLYIVDPQNTNIVIFQNGNQYLFLYGYTIDTHIMRLNTQSDVNFPTDADMTMGNACIYQTNWKHILYWEV